MPRNPSPGQPVHVPGNPALFDTGVTHMWTRCWHRGNGQWVAHINTYDGVALLNEAGISESTSFSLTGGLFNGKSFASLLWIDPEEVASVQPAASPFVAGRLRGAGFHIDGTPLDLKNADGIIDFVQVILMDRGWIGLRENGELVRSDDVVGNKNVVRLLPGLYNSFGIIDRDGRLSIERADTDGVKAIPEDAQRIGVVDARWEGGQAIALLKDGSVRVWGEHYTSAFNDQPAWPAPPAEALQDVRQIAITLWRAATLRKDGKLHIWGGHGGEAGPFDLEPFAKWGEIVDIQSGYARFRVLTRKDEVHSLGGSRPLTAGRVAEGIEAIVGNLLLPKGSALWAWNAESRASAQAEVDALLQQIGNLPRGAFDLLTVGENDATKVAAVWIEAVAGSGAAGPPAAAVPPRLALEGPSALAGSSTPPPFSEAGIAAFAKLHPEMEVVK